MNGSIKQIAHQKILITALFKRIREFFAEYVCEGEADFSVSTTPADITFEREKSIREDILEGREPREYSDAYLETISIQRKIAEELFSYDTLLFHGSVVAVDGEGYLFTAKSGTGKSTHTRLWRELLGEKTVMVNDDKPFLQITGNGVAVHGSPWNGKHHLGENISVPLKAICILERGEENSIQKITPKDALLMLMQQSNRPLDARKMPKYLELLDALSEKTTFYRLRCNMNPQAAVISYGAMSK